MKNIHIFPVRHHSPASSLLVGEFIQSVRPDIILIEGPADANHLLEILTDAETEPPVAILAYYLPAGEIAEPRYLMYPFANYSPEYVALKQARADGRPARFIDIPAAVAVQLYEKYEQFAGSETFFSELVARSGYRSFEEFWEASFENGGLTVAEFSAALLDYARLLREQHEPPSTPPFDDTQARLRVTAEFQKDLLREQFMAAEIRKALAEGYAPEKILFVCGAFHAAAFADDSWERRQDAGALAARLPPPLTTELTVIPYSYPRLAEQLGYGAGNRAPLYYEKVYAHQGDFARAALETMLTCMNYLYVKGYGVSLADVIEAHRLAKILANMRRKHAPGLEEIREALAAALLYGATEVADRFLGDILIGRSVGRVSAKIGKTALQQEFYREVRQRKLPLTDSPQDFILHLTNPLEIGTSIFLHRLRLCQIPFAQNKETVASAYDYLAQVREKWQAQWTPAVDARLVEKSMLGNSFLEVCRRALAERLNAAQNAREAAETLLEIAVCDAKDLLPQAQAACESLASADDDFGSLAKACQNLQALISYGSSRDLQAEGFAQILTQIFNRAVLLLPAAAQAADDAVEQVCAGLTILSDLCARSPLVNRELFEAAIRALLDSYAAHPKVTGLAAAIAHLAKMLAENELLTCLKQRLSRGNPPLHGALFLDGFLSVNKIVLVHNRALVTLLDHFVQAIRPEDFVTTLPVLRRAFAELTQSERHYFSEHLRAIHNIAAAQAVQPEIAGQAETLKELDQFSQDLDALF